MTSWPRRLHEAAVAALGLAPGVTAKEPSAESLAAVQRDAETRCAGAIVGPPWGVAAAERYAGELDEPAVQAGTVDLLIFSDNDSPAGRLLGTAAFTEAWRRASLSVLGRDA
jgi:shikimate 5-dehydrogenase